MTDLWSLTVAFRTINTSLRLTYSDGKQAAEAYELLKRPHIPAEDAARGLPEIVFEDEVEVTDSYGTTATIDRTQIMIHWLTNMGAEAEGQKAVSTLQAHAQAQLRRKLENDPLLKGMIQMPPSGGFKLNG